VPASPDPAGRRQRLGESRLESVALGAAPDITLRLVNGSSTVSSQYRVGDVQGNASSFTAGAPSFRSATTASASGLDGPTPALATVIGNVIVSNIFSPGLSAGGTLTVFDRPRSFFVRQLLDLTTS